MSERLKLVVIVEKDSGLRAQILAQIPQIGTARVIECTSPDQARRPIVTSNCPGILVVGLGEKPQACRYLVALCRARIPSWTILVLDHLDAGDSAAAAFASGADDVLRVPHAPSEFKARLNLRLRQAEGVRAKSIPSQIDRSLAAANFTPVEAEIMNFLTAHKGEIVTRNQLSQHLENHDWIYGDRKYDVHVTKIRKKIKAHLGGRFKVETVRSVGYYLRDASSAELG